MRESGLVLLEDLVANLRLGVTSGAYTHCPETWRDIDYVPDYNKFYFIEDGEGWLRIGDAEYRPKPGQLFLMPAGVPQSYSTVKDKPPFVKYWCHFTARIGDTDLFGMLDMPHFVDVTDTPGMTALFRRLLAAYGEVGAAAALRVRSALMEIIACYLETAEEHGVRWKRVTPLHAFGGVLSYIQEHIGQDLTAAALAQRLHYHPNYFTRMFHKYTGMAPTQYINRARLEKAKLLLRTTDMMVAEIATVAGFGDIYYFSKSFKKYTGFSPSDFRAL